MSTRFTWGRHAHLCRGAPIKKRFEGLQEHFSFDERSHVNVEGTPGSITQEVAELLGEFNTNRVTLGIQSLDEKNY